MSEHKKCPHCGQAEARAVKLNTWYRIVCANCGASSSRGSTEAEAWAAWDRRDDEKVKALVEALHKIKLLSAYKDKGHYCQSKQELQAAHDIAEHAIKAVEEGL